MAPPYVQNRHPFVAQLLMPRRLSSGLLLYKRDELATWVLLVHPSGAYNRRAPWSIPKGELDAGESEESAARRECLEETGVAAGDLVRVGTIDYVKSRKTVVAYAGPAPIDATPRCASWEVDRAEFVRLDEARKLIHPDQLPFLDYLADTLKLPSGVKASDG